MSKRSPEQIVGFLILLFMASIGVINVVGTVIDGYVTLLGVVGSFVLLSVSAFGVIWLFNSITRKKKMGIGNLAVGIALIVGGVFLYKFAPESFPTIFSLIGP